MCLLKSHGGSPRFALKPPLHLFAPEQIKGNYLYCSVSLDEFSIQGVSYQRRVSCVLKLLAFVCLPIHVCFCTEDRVNKAYYYELLHKPCV